MKLRFHGIFLFFGEGRVLLRFLWQLAFTPPEPYPGLHLIPAAGGLAVPRFQTSPSSKAPFCKGSCLPVTGSPPKPSASGFGGERRCDGVSETCPAGERRCDGVSETCPASQGRGERYTVRTDEAEGLTQPTGLLQNHNFATDPFLMVKRKALLFSDFLGGNQRPRWGRSAGPDFSPMRNRGKNRQRRGLPPPCGIHPAGNPPRGTGSPCVLLVSALSLVGSHRWHGHSIEYACSLGSWHFFCQGLTLVSRCFQLTGAWPPAAGTPLFQGRPGGGNHLMIGPAAQCSLVWWQ